MIYIALSNLSATRVRLVERFGETTKTHIVDWDEEKYNKSRVRERIQMLKDRLPSFLVEKNQIYSIISSGIHELTEDQCLKFYPVLRNSIEIILAEQNALKESEADRKRLASSIREIEDEIRGNNPSS